LVSWRLIENERLNNVAKCLCIRMITRKENTVGIIEKDYMDGPCIWRRSKRRRSKLYIACLEQANRINAIVIRWNIVLYFYVMFKYLPANRPIGIT